MINNYELFIPGIAGTFGRTESLMEAIAEGKTVAKENKVSVCILHLPSNQVAYIVAQETGA